ncbi:MAG: response regulator [Oscillospiraceae bacterium]|nr:response regulator [Oscillospiraceae bacterium]
MYKLLIAEDDPAILDKLQHTIDWESMGFQLCGAVTSGTDAMQGITLLKPDVLLTDMEMPGATGLELIQWIAKENYPVKTVVLSAYDHYQYVRSSLRSGAFDYLLKPVNEEKLRELFHALAKTIEEEKQTWNDPSQDSHYLHLSQQVAFSHIFLNYLLGNHTDPKMLQLTLDNFGIGPDSLLSIALLRPNHLYQMEQLSQQLAQLGQQLAVKPFFIQYQKQTVFVFPAGGMLLRNFLQGLVCAESDYQCILSESVPFSQLPVLFQKTSTNRSLWFYLPYNRIVPINLNSGTQQESDPAFPQADTIYNLIKRNQVQPLTAMLDAFFSACNQAMLNPDILTIQMADLYSSVVGSLRMVQPKLNADDFEAFYLMLQRQTCLAQFRDAVVNAFCALAESFCSLVAAKGDLIDRVQEYIQQHFAEDISLSSLSETFYVTPAYLSSLFSKRTNQTITNYLQNIRLDKAAALLLDNSQTVAQIGAAIGYPSYPHFCRLFKRRFHVTPTDYRDLHRL